MDKSEQYLVDVLAMYLLEKAVMAFSAFSTAISLSSGVMSASFDIWKDDVVGVVVVFVRKEVGGTNAVVVA